MIPHNELRIGNIIKSCLTGEIVHTDWLVIKHISDGNYQNSYHPDQPVYEPIPITEDWLIRLGFKKGEPFIRSMGYFIDRFGVFYHFEEKSYYSWTVCIKYIHQLQNLYFALTWKELELKQNA